MLAVKLRGPREVVVVETDAPRPGPGEVQLKIAACGVCGSDLNAWRGVAGIEYPLAPGAPGHETVGTISDIGAGVDPVWCGQRVTGLLWNGFAEFGVTGIANVVAVPSGSEEILGEPLACAANVVRRARIGSDDGVAIVGFGYLAALIAQCLPRARGGWIAIARRSDSRDLALHLGATAAYAFGEVPDAAWDRFPVVIETTGAQEPLDYATWLTGYGGRLVIAGYHADGPRSVNMQSWNWKGLDVINAHERQPATYLQALQAVLPRVSGGEIRTDALHTHSWPLARVAEAFAAAESHPAGFVKAIVRP